METWNTLAFWKPGRAREAPFSLQAMWLWCRTVGSTPKHTDTDHPTTNLLQTHRLTVPVCTLSYQPERAQAQPTTHTTHDKETNCGVGVGVGVGVAIRS